MINLSYCVYLILLARLEKQREKSRSYRAKNPEKIKNYAKEYVFKNKERLKAANQLWRRENLEHDREKTKAWRKANPDKVREYDRRKMAKRRTVPEYKILASLRARIRNVLFGQQKSAPTLKLLGCSTKELREHLEKQFRLGMTWKNYGRTGWHIDHIRPCANFDLTDPVQQRECFHYTNLQPLWALDNIKKGKF